MRHRMNISTSINCNCLQQLYQHRGRAGPAGIFLHIIRELFVNLCWQEYYNF